MDADVSCHWGPLAEVAAGVALQALHLLYGVAVDVAADVALQALHLLSGVADGSDSEQESNEGDGTSRKFQKRSQAKVPPKTSKGFEGRLTSSSQAMASSYDQLPLLKKKRTGDSSIHVKNESNEVDEPGSLEDPYSCGRKPQEDLEENRKQSWAHEHEPVKSLLDAVKAKVPFSFLSSASPRGMDFGNNFEEMFKCMGKKWENCEGRPNAEAQKFYRRVEEGKQPLFPGCTNFSRLGFMIRLYHLKRVHGISESAFGEFLMLMKESFPEAHLPLSFNAAKIVIKDLGLHYEKIHACPNSCMLYWAENKDKDECHTCGVSRWVVQEKKGSGVNNEPEKLIHKVPTNVMRYFPLKLRLQRMFMRKEFSKIMTWHAVGRKKDGKLRYPADGEAWKMMDAQYPDFSPKHRNVNLGTLLNISGKSKDHLEAHFDLQKQNIRKPLHPVLFVDGKSYEIRPVIFDMTKKEKEIFCSVLKNAKLPYGYASNISRYVSVSEKKVVGYKSHDAHCMLHYLLQFTVRRTLKPEVALPLIKLGTFLRGLWSKVIDLNDLKKLQKDIFDILCRFEMIFIQSLFDITVHLLVHLCREVEYGGPVQLRSMFPIERFLGKFKSYVRNRSKPEGSIIEGYLEEECVTFCYRFLTGEGETEDTMSHSARNASLEYHIGTKKNQDGKVFKLKHADWKVSHQYVLFNSGNNDIESLIREHRVSLEASPEKPLKRKFVTTHQLQQQKKKMDKKLPEVGGWQDILTKESGQDVAINENEKVTARSKLALEPCAGDVEDTGNNGNKDVVEKLPPPPLSEYLKFKKAGCRGDSEDTHIDVAEKLPPPSPLPMFLKRNMKKVKTARLESSSKSKGKKGKETAIEEDDSQYVPANEGDVESDDSSEDIEYVKQKKIDVGPRTRSQANAAPGKSGTATERAATRAYCPQPVKPISTKIFRQSSNDGPAPGTIAASHYKTVK
ncbi:hypothetical protein AgCh_034660 [Apium graveolens]